MHAHNIRKQTLRWFAQAAAPLALLTAFVTAAHGQVPGTPRIPGQNLNGMRVFLWTGLKTHSPGQHDYPQFLADWSKLLTERGAVVNGALRPRVAKTLKGPMSW